MALPPVIPWEPMNIPEEIQNELNRRKINRSFRYVDSAKGEWDTTTGEWTKYRGPMSPWVRLCSNGAGRNYGTSKNPNFSKQGFVLYGGKGFYSEYGFSKQASRDLDNRSIIGYLPDGITPHVIENDLKTSNYPIHVPVPEIERINITIQKELYRKAEIEWTCFSKAQLEYMTPYFLVPGISCILEFGWNLYNPEVLLDLTDTTKLKNYNDNPYPLYIDHILKSKGNYDILMGRVTHFEWSIDGNKIKCKTEITSQDRIYTGLMVDAKAEARVLAESGEEEKTNPFGSLSECMDKVLPQFRSIATVKDPTTLPLIKDIVNYVKKHHPDNWEEYVYGVFYGRDPADLKKSPEYDNKQEDFDRKSQNKDLWINLGLAIECINKYASPLQSLSTNSEIFRIDIDDVVINAHPNLISCDGTILLIPNAAAPKYFNGSYGYVASENTTQALADYKILDNTSDPSLKLTNVTKKEAIQKGRLADYRIRTVCLPMGGHIYRDNLDELINRVRYENTSRASRDNAFPFAKPLTVIAGSKPYPEKYTGRLRDLYVNVEYLKSLTNSDSVKTYYQLIEKIMQDISDAAGGFWDFRLVSGTGKQGQKNNEQATMKIVDYKFVNTQNRGVPYTFDYFDADGLLLNVNFKPTLSNAQAIRTIYAQTNQPDKNVTLTNGNNELLDYHFKDRLAMDNDTKSQSPPPLPDTQHAETMRDLEQLSAPPGVYQMTTKNAQNQIVIRRLVLPSSDILQMLLDDGDEENNPKYTGIMPGIQATFTIQGIGGLRTFMMFLVRNLPEPYSEQNIVFRIVDIQDSIESGKWMTTITAGIIPLRGYIKRRLGIPVKSS